MKKVGTFFGCIWVVVAFFLVQIAGTFVFSVAYTISQYNSIVDATDIKSAIITIQLRMMTGNVQSLMLLTATAFTTFMGIVWYCIRYRKIDTRKFKDNLSVRTIVIIVVVGIASNVGLSFLMGMVQPLFPKLFEQYAKLIELSGVGVNPISIFTAIVLAPIGEETLFRGVILTKSRKIMPFLWANIFQSVLFGVVHGNIVQGVYVFIFGLLLGYVQYRYQNIIYPILLHAVFNTCGQTLGYLYLDHIAFYIVVGVISLVGLIWGIKQINSSVSQDCAIENTEHAVTVEKESEE